MIRLSSKVNNIGDDAFIKNVFSKLEERQKNYILLIDKVYFKTRLNFHDGTLLGSSANKPEHLANTGYPLCLFIWWFKVFIKNVTSIIIKHGNFIEIIDNNRTNQAYF